MPDEPSLGLKVFSATKARDREALGETITVWIRAHPECELIGKTATQSSDAEFHCLAITLVYRLRTDAIAATSTKRRS